MMRARIGLLGLALLTVVGIAAAEADADVVHFALAASVPEADAAVPSPAEVTLRFTEVPQANSVAIRLVDAGGTLVESGSPTQDAESPTVYRSAIDGSLRAGGYTVAWRGIGDDGHIVRGEFAFTVTAE